MDTNTGIAHIVDKNTVLACTLDQFLKKLIQNEIPYIIVEDNASQQEIMEMATKKFPNKEVIVIYDCTAIMNQYKAWHNSCIPIQFFYAYKCNPSPVQRLLTSSLPGICYDDASIDEINKCLTAGVDASCVIYANPVKGEDGIIYMVENNVFIGTVDSPEEVQKMYEILGEKASKCKAVIRIHVDDSHSIVPLGSKFGCMLYEVEGIMETCKKCNISVVGIAFHVGSGNSDKEAYHKAIHDAREAFKMGEKYGFTMNLLDLGGGWAGDLCDENLHNAGLEATHAIIRDALQEYGFFDIPNFKLMAEPGRYMNYGTISCACQITGAYERNGYHYYRISDSVLGLFKDVILCGDIGYRLLDENDSSRECYPSRILGSSLLKYDYLKEVLSYDEHGNEKDVKDTYNLPALHVGDYLRVNNIGAYTLSISAATVRDNFDTICVIRKSSLKETVA